MKKKEKEKEEARRLRREGYSVKDIVKLVGVTQASVSVWCRDIILTEEQNLALKKKRSTADNSSFYFKKRAIFRNKGMALAIKYANEPMFAAGCFLYWGEGNKRKQDVLLANGDPELVLFFVTWLRRYFGVKIEDLHANITHHSTSDIPYLETKNFWKHKLNLADSCFRSSTILSGNVTKRNKAPYGFIRVGLYSTEINQMILGALQHYANFYREQWSY